MSLAHKTARGALWTIITSIGGRAVGLLGTLVMTRFLSPDAIGEVSVATIICMTANWLTIWGFGPYAVVKGKTPDEVRAIMWHCTVAYVGLGVIGLGGAAALGGYLTPYFDAPAAARYVPGMALAIFLRRFSSTAERVLARDLRFREIGVAIAIGEVAYTASALTLAAAGQGGMAIVYANWVQAILTSALLIRAAGVATWATRVPLSRERIADMLRFGVPLGIESLAHNASRYWDNLAISSYFGAGATGAYNMAYNLADVPAIQVGEQLATVLLPSMAKLPPERRPRALERSTALLSLIIFPLAVGLGLVAAPLIALVLPADKWQQVAPLLSVLAGLSVFRPITWVLSVYMDAQERTTKLMVLEVAKIMLLLAGIAILARWGIMASASAVGVAFFANAVAGVAMVRSDGVSMREMLRGFAQPAVCCALMVGAVLAARFGVSTWRNMAPAAQLVAEIALGATVYVASALVVCRRTAKDLLSLLRGATKRSGDA